MRVTFVCASLDLTGGSRVIATHARLLAQSGHQVTVVVPAWKPLPIGRRLRRLWETGHWESSTTPPSHYEGMDLDIRRIDHRPILEADVPDADVVIATWWETAEWVNAFGPRKGAKVYFVQGHETFDLKRIERVRATYHMPFFKIVVSEWLNRIMAQTYGDSTAVLVPNAVDHAAFDVPSREKQPMPTVGFCYTEGAVKGLEVSLQVVRELKRTLPNLRVVSFGVRPPRGNHGLGADFQFCLRPTAKELRESYAACDVWLCSSRSEGFGLPAMEAMACGTPVVSTRVGWPMESIQDGVNGFLVSIDDANALKEAALKCLTAEPPAWRAMSQSARETARSYRWDKSAALFAEALEAAAQKNMPVPCAQVSC